ncbi:Uncharacterised protein [uncultured archaeon]|nr:Uncharacterised protein [uncultured archaeon]
MEEEMNQKNIIVKVEKERVEFKKLILENPNYFDTFPDIKIEPVFPMSVNTKYEELRCIGFYPDQDLLEAIISVKLPYGYKGNLCSQGSYEYVRFFIDWNGDGDFSDPSEDVGIVSVNVHDIPDGEKVCLENTKPISYAVTLKIDSRKLKCTIPNMVKVRAILSWDMQPQAGNPGFTPVWGNVVEKFIQIKPVLKWRDISKVSDLKLFGVDPSILDLDIPVSKLKELNPAELKEIYKDKHIPEHRFNFAELKTIADKVKLDPNLMVKYKLDPKFSEIVENIGPILAEKPSTRYEQLHCVGLNYDTDTLEATLTVKQPYGYNGSLCTKGSYEYVGFWAYIWDQIEQMCHWKYLGLSSVNVHDIKNIPPEGLQYAVFLPVDLSGLKDKCSKPKIIKIRAILSWQTPPAPNDPNHSPVWGNKVDALIQIKPGISIGPGEQISFISVVGGMAVNKISGNSETTIPSSIGDGYANGVNALESPFGGVVSICGHISNPPNDPVDADKLKYKVQYKKSGDTWQDITNKFRIYISTWNGINWSQSPKDQVAVGGYYKYEEDLTPPVQRFVDASDYSGGSVLSDWHTPVPEGDGLYEVRVLLFKPGAPPAPDVPADHISSNVVKVMIDNTRPQAEISLDAGPCTKYKVGDTITGKFTATDVHIWQYSLAVEPSVPVPPAISPAGETYPALPVPGRTDEVFELVTASDTTPCGYVIHLYVWDRTIVNNYMQGNQKGATVGFCLLKQE